MKKIEKFIKLEMSKQINKLNDITTLKKQIDTDIKNELLNINVTIDNNNVFFKSFNFKSKNELVKYLLKHNFKITYIKNRRVINGVDYERFLKTFK